MKYKKISKSEAIASLHQNNECLMIDKNTGELFKLKIRQDEYSENPRDWGDNIGTIVSVRGNWDIADRGNSMTSDEMSDWYEEHKDDENYYILPVYMYEHSGMTISLEPFGDEWDSGQCGYIYTTKYTVLNNTSSKEVDWKNKAKEWLADEIKTYDDYIRDEVYEYDICKLVKIEHRNLTTGETWITNDWDVVDACGGYLGDINESGLLDDAVGDIYEFVEEEE